MQIMNWITRTLAARLAPTVEAETITLGDRDRRYRVMIDPGLPDDAYHQLFHLDLPENSAGVLEWDYAAGGWRTG